MDIYETDRLILKSTNESDASFVLELMNSPKWVRYIGDRQVRTLKDAKTYIKDKMEPQFKRLGFGNYTLILKANNIKIGCCGLYDRKGVEGLDIGFALLEAYENQGYAYEAAKKVLDLGLNAFGYHKISAITTKENAASQKLLRKLGLTFRKYVDIPDDAKDLMLFEISK